MLICFTSISNNCCLAIVANCWYVVSFLGSEECCFQYQSILEDSSDEDDIPEDNVTDIFITTPGINVSDTAEVDISSTAGIHKKTPRRRKLIKEVFSVYFLTCTHI